MKAINQINQQNNVAIIGGGAAGFFAAANITANGASVSIFEASKSPLAKVLISGGGRCNVTHNCLDNNILCGSYPRGQRELKSAFSRFSVTDTIKWFESKNIPLKTEEDGRMFPKTNKSETIANCLKSHALDSGAKLYLNSPVKNIAKDPNGQGFIITTRNKKTDSEKTHLAKFIILATGGSKKGFGLAKSLGHSIATPAPSLFSFEIVNARLKELSGVSFKQVKLTLPRTLKTEITGPLLITHWGLSGPAVIKLSAFAARELQAKDYKCSLQVNFIPELTQEAALEQLREVKDSYSKKEIQNTTCFGLPKAFWIATCEYLNIPKKLVWAEASKKQLNLLAQSLTHAEFQIIGKGRFKEEFVTCGGINLKEVDFKTMESKVCPNLFLAGEVLDIDGITGGFNFQSAWTTAWIAAKSI